ncbi:hypothetical protein HYW42_05270 [Candidatus Daviesbacteria bacterium]|nr:hypothetical protein [Candidatus Daviesbacteria bacterium]
MLKILRHKKSFIEKLKKDGKKSPITLANILSNAITSQAIISGGRIKVV